MGAILVTVADGVAEIVFNRPERLNALDLEMTTGFAAAVERVLTDVQTRAIVLRGEGRAFVAGGDLAWLRAASDRAVAADELIRPIHEGLKRLRADGPPTVVALQGPVAGAGMSLALAADLAVADETTTFTMAYGRVAASPDCGGSWSLPRILGRKKALELTLLNEAVGAPTALALGLVNRVVPAGTAAMEAHLLARRLAVGAPAAMARTRRLIDAAFATPFDRQLDDERTAFVEGAASADFDEALAAFHEKRRPVFTGT